MSDGKSARFIEICGSAKDFLTGSNFTRGLHQVRKRNWLTYLNLKLSHVIEPSDRAAEFIHDEYQLEHFSYCMVIQYG